MSRLLSVATILIFISTCGRAQTTLLFSDQGINSESSGIKAIEVDRLDQIYVVDHEDALSILNPNQSRPFQYLNNQLGSIASIDVTNPQRVLVYYRDYQTIVFLDNVLNEIERLDLSKTDFTDVIAVAQSNDGNIWAYDSGVMKLLKLNKSGELLFESNTFRDFNFEESEIVKIIEYDNQVFLLSEYDGVHLFDNYSRYIKTLPIYNVSDIQVLNSNIIYVLNDSYHSFSMIDLDTTSSVFKDMDLINIKQIRVMGSYLVVLDGNSILQILKK